MSLLKHFAARAPVPVFIAGGHGSHEIVQNVALMADVYAVPSPRRASQLLVVGDIDPAHLDALKIVHDQLPHPRSTVWCCSEPLFEFTSSAGSNNPPTIATTADNLPQLIGATQRQLLTDQRCSESDLNADQPPAPWRGQGDHGQGGEGMMGGKPYGRPMAMMDADLRDGLMLDALTFSVGPFFQGLPTGLMAQVTLQGDVIQSWEVTSKPYPIKLPAPFRQGFDGEVDLAQLEIARAQTHLHRLAQMLVLDGLDHLAQQTRLLAGELDAAALASVLRRLDKLKGRLTLAGFFTVARGIGAIDLGEAKNIGGFVARAAGVEADARSGIKAYRALDFSPVTHPGSDLQARRLQLFAEVEQALTLARNANHSRLNSRLNSRFFIVAEKVLETPHGPIHAGQAEDQAGDLLSALLPGMEWREALLTIASLPVAGTTSQRPLDAKGAR